MLSVDEKSQIQALDRTAPLLPMRMGDAEKRTHDYHRHGTSTLFAALEAATGQVTGAVKPRHRWQEFLSFLRQINRAYPDQELHLVMDNDATHKTAEVRQWLDEHPRFHVHFTPTSGSWLSLVEVWFGIIDRQAIKSGVFTSVKDLNAKIRAFITGWNKRKHPSCGQRHQSRCWKKRNPKQLQKRDTRYRKIAPPAGDQVIPPVARSMVRRPVVAGGCNGDENLYPNTQMCNADAVVFRPLVFT
ncbi:DDE superfamily endonuclease [Brevibacterium sp. 239c]|nr:DDE superfamily endonuclease [Brevibacterium sp. 239c]